MKRKLPQKTHKEIVVTLAIIMLALAGMFLAQRIDNHEQQALLAGSIQPVPLTQLKTADMNIQSVSRVINYTIPGTGIRLASVIKLKVKKQTDEEIYTFAKIGSFWFLIP